MTHLFVLPREIRDKIYNYLYEPGPLCLWDYPLSLGDYSENEPPTDAHGLRSVNIQSDREPIEKLIIPGSKATEEYLQATIFQNREVTIKLCIRNVHHSDSVSRKAPEFWNVKSIHWAEAAELIKAAKHLNILTEVIGMPDEDRTSERLYGLLGALLGTLSAENPSLSTIRLIVRLASTSFMPFDLSPFLERAHDWARGSHDPEFIPFILPMYGFRMPIAQQVESYRLALEPLGTFGNPPPITFAIVKTVAALFVKNESGNDRLYWTEEEVLEGFPSRPIPETSDYEWYVRLEERVRQWMVTPMDLKTTFELIRMGEERKSNG